MAALAELHFVIPEAILLLVGETYTEEQGFLASLRDSVSALGLEPFVRFLGFVEDVRELYSASDVAILCTHSEPSGRVVLEAMAMGVPIVAPQSGGPREIIEDALSGLLYDPTSVVSLAAAINRVYSNPTFRSTMISNALRRVKVFSRQNHVAAICGVYQSLIGSRKAANRNRTKT